MREGRFQRAFLLLLLVAISAAFAAMIRGFLMTILLAAVFAGLAYPLYARFLGLLRGRRALASATTLALLLLVVAAPLLAVLGVVAREAIRVSEAVTPWVRQQLQEPAALAGLFERVPAMERLEPYRAPILTKAGAIVGSAGDFLFRSLSATTRGTVSFLFHFFLMLYTMFFFLMDGERLLARVLQYMPLPEGEQRRMVRQFVSVTRATLKGTFLIGLLQGGLAGAAFAVAGIDGALFWGTLMVLLSIVPGVGTALIWLPASAVLAAIGRAGAGIGLAVWCALVVGSVDNVLRPRLVGRDARLHELLILFGTLGGIVIFGVVGFIVGPILAGLFATIWEIYGTAFRDVLPASRAAPGGGEEGPSVR